MLPQPMKVSEEELLIEMANEAHLEYLVGEIQELEFDDDDNDDEED